MDKFKRSAKIFLMATAMISNFFVIDYAHAATNPPPTPATPTTYTTASAPTLTYGLNFAYVQRHDNNGQPAGDPVYGGLNISIDSVYGKGLDGFLFQNITSSFNYKYKKPDGSETIYSSDKYLAYFASEQNDGTQENDILTSDLLTILVDKDTKRIAMIGKCHENMLDVDITPYEPQTVLTISKSSSSPVNAKTYSAERAAVLRVLDDIIVELKANSPPAVASSADPAVNLDVALKQIGNYTDRRALSKKFFLTYFNECDVNFYSVIHFPAESSTLYDAPAGLDLATTPERDKVAADPSPSNRPQIDIGSGQSLKTSIDNIGWADVFNFADHCGTLPTNLLSRPATTWVLEKTGKSGNSDFWESVGVNTTLDRAIFYFKMKPLASPKNQDEKNLNYLSNYVYLCIQVYGNEIYADWAFSDFGFNAANLVLKGVVKDVNANDKFPLAHSFVMNIAQFTFNQSQCDPRSVTVVQKSTVASAGVTKGPNLRLNLNGQPKGQCKIDSDYTTMNVDGIQSLQFAESINDIQKTPPPGESADPAASYYGYLSAWGIVGYNTMGSSTISSNQYNADIQDNSCGCGEVRGANIMMILKRAFCAVICWTFNVGKGLQENATCLFNDALGTLDRNPKKHIKNGEVDVLCT